MFRVDRGAIKFVLSGANIMCPGLTSAGGALDEEVIADAPVAIMAEGKQHALAIGYTKMSAQDMYVLSLKYFVQCIILLWVEMLLQLQEKGCVPMICLFLDVAEGALTKE
jgi:predicted RNA-binding protein (TIGR00451 family)